MPSKKRERHKRAGPQNLAKVEVADRAASSQILDAGPFGVDYPRLLLALRDAAPGALIFVQINSPVQRQRLPEQLAADGLQRPFAVADFTKLPPGPPPDGVLREFLEDLRPNTPEILFVDGLEHRIDADPKPGGVLEELNLSRERLASLGVVVVFLLPIYLIDLIRSHALNLWTWRAHHYILDPDEATLRHDGIIQSLDTGHTTAPGDTPEARERRIRILRRLLDEGLAEHRTVESLTHSILIPLGRDLYDAGRYAEVLNVLDRVKGTIEKAEDSQDTAATLNLRALSLLSLGNFREAEPLLKQALEVLERVIGSEHLTIAAAMNNLAGFYERQGRYAEAEPLYRKSLSVAEKVLGLEHPNTATSLNNLAGLYVALGKYAEAEQLYRLSLAIRERTLGLEHQETAASLNNAIWEKTFGPEHRDVATTLNNLAEVYRAQGKYAEAEPLYRRALKITEKIFGPEHLDVVTTLNNLALLYVHKDRANLAEPLLQRALTIAEKNLNPDHPLVTKCRENYVVLLRKMNRQIEAAEIEARVRAIRERYAQENAKK